MIDMMFVLSIFKNKTYCLFVLFILSLSTTSCTSIGRIISTPNYSHHSVDKILLDNIKEKQTYSRCVGPDVQGGTVGNRVAGRDAYAGFANQA